MALDAGYVPSETTTSAPESADDYNRYLSSFAFADASSRGGADDAAAVKASSSTTTAKPVIVAAGAPKILMRNVYREGKMCVIRAQFVTIIRSAIAKRQNCSKSP